MTETATTTRPLIDFSDVDIDRRTVRQYAKALQSRINKPETNALLKQVAAGKQVDAYALAAALPDVFSGCATRAAHSTGRRVHARQARAIAHIVHAVLANHADGLPALAPGERSRVTEEAKRALTEARNEIDALVKIRNSQAESLAKEKSARLAAERALNQAAAEQVRDTATTEDLLTFALGLLSETDRARVEGFRAGLAARS